MVYRGTLEGAAEWGGQGRTSIKIPKDNQGYPVVNKGKLIAKTQS